jgi:hypothetical protein
LREGKLNERKKRTEYEDVDREEPVSCLPGFQYTTNLSGKQAFRMDRRMTGAGGITPFVVKGPGGFPPFPSARLSSTLTNGYHRLYDYPNAKNRSSRQHPAFFPNPSRGTWPDGTEGSFSRQARL